MSELLWGNELFLGQCGRPFLLPASSLEGLRPDYRGASPSSLKCVCVCVCVCVCEREAVWRSLWVCECVSLSTELWGQRALRCAKHVSSSVAECPLNDATPPGLHRTLLLYSQLSKTKTDSLINTGIHISPTNCFILLYPSKKPTF